MLGTRCQLGKSPARGILTLPSLLLPRWHWRPPLRDAASGQGRRLPPRPWSSFSPWLSHQHYGVPENQIGAIGDGRLLLSPQSSSLTCPISGRDLASSAFFRTISPKKTSPPVAASGFSTASAGRSQFRFPPILGWR